MSEGRSTRPSTPAHDAGTRPGGPVAVVGSRLREFAHQLLFNAPVFHRHVERHARDKDRGQGDDQVQPAMPDVAWMGMDVVDAGVGGRLVGHDGRVDRLCFGSQQAGVGNRKPPASGPCVGVLLPAHPKSQIITMI